MKNHLLCALFAATMVLIGCKKEAETPRVLQFRENQEFNLTFESEESTASINFVTTEMWMASKSKDTQTDNSWFNFYPEYGESGSTTLVLKISENEGDADRTGSFKIKSGNEEQLFTIVQYGRNSANSNYVYIADANFKSYLLQNFDTDGDWRLSKDEAAAITEISCEDYDITSLDGVQYMTALTSLNCRYNQIAGDVNLSGLKDLKEVKLDHNYCSKIDLSGCSALETLIANDNMGYDDNMNTVFTLTEVNLSGCSSLKTLNVVDNAITSLNLKDCTELEDLNASYNALVSINISNCSKLRYAHIRTNNFEGPVDFSHCSELTFLDAHEANLTGLNVSGCSKLVQLIAYRNTGIKSIDVSGCPELTELNLYETGITGIDLKNNPKLVKLNLGYTGGITSIDLSNCTKIQELNLQENKLTTLDVSACRDLQVLKAEFNQLTSVNLKGCTALNKLYIYNNNLQDIDLSTNTSLGSLAIYENKITTLDITPCASTLYFLDCHQNGMTELKLDKMPLLNSLDASINSLTSLDLRGCPELAEVFLSKNNLSDLKVRGLAKMATCEFQSNALSRIDLRGCSAIDELHLSDNNLNYVSFYECTALRYVDCQRTKVTSLDFSNNEKMAFLFADENPQLKTIYIREGSAYSSLAYDETTTVYQKAPSTYDNVGGDNWGDDDVDPWKK